MIKAMRTAATGMVAQQMNVDNIANNLANVNTTGFKQAKIEFQDVLYQNLRRAGTATAIGTEVPTGLAIGYGTRASATVRQYAEGNLTPTGNPLDLAIDGDGFFQVQMPDGTTAYTRDGAFKISGDGQIVTSDGYFLLPQVSIPQDATALAVGTDGTIEVMVAGQSDPVEIGQIELARFVNPAGLLAVGRNLLTPTRASGDALTDVPTQSGLGQIDQGYLEMSNVKVVDEMVNMIVAQRAYEMNSKAIQTADDMAQIANNLKR
ncbi:MAG TPA: flagellar basal-body rod protein FlgG [candidate division Zixibacteria bacterium]|nr:flagellar basal-body rod protein FlgG [candidate division Zixibacteria bacterium]MDD4917154.1 flagellar basal-body rod protein FlgG [candidate division Zixibacteria bacterium]MDM7972662.1 flagellar basal-body rod protein FlgG [candidate division Zixibacteria bacterium]HOD65422.1 flagellar basal-body rod protein FlgG [candidate division Zixibacteria bacterium]HPI31799.1 flagellar basal-body rod protein FlgG [candidate division Zixibacteria bacterium]